MPVLLIFICNDKCRLTPLPLIRKMNHVVKLICHNGMTLIRNKTTKQIAFGRHQFLGN